MRTELADKQAFYLGKVDRLIKGLESDRDETRMFRLLQLSLLKEPELMIEILDASIALAKAQLNQDRATGSSASLYYPVETGVRYLARKLDFFTGEKDPFSPASWTEAEFLGFLRLHKEGVIQISGQKTTAKNLPQRAMAVSWLLSQIKPDSWTRERYGFIELGASLGLILSALQQPQRFARWFRQQPEAATVPSELLFDLEGVEGSSPGLGLDLVAPDDWSIACIGDDKKRAAVKDFCASFPLSQVLACNALRIDELPEVANFLALCNQEGRVPVIYSCATLYQFDPVDRAELEKKIRRLLSVSGGYFLKIDIAKYMGCPELPGNSIGWVEDASGLRVTSKFKFSGETYDRWEVLA